MFLSGKGVEPWIIFLRKAAETPVNHEFGLALFK
jgi:hypothetical protein